MIADWPPWRCPEHQVDLVDQGDILVCPQGETFPCLGGIPRFVPDRTYADAFGLQWLEHRKTQLDSHSGTAISEERARRAIGEELWNRLNEMVVLECGCGAGRFTEILLARGARLMSVDLSTAVEANGANFPVSEEHRIAQADILSLPFPRASFDLVFCLGVVQHTPDPETTIRALYTHVKPGGFLAFDHYSRKLAWRLSLAPLFRMALKRLPPAAGLKATDALVDLLLPLHRRAHGLAGVLLRRISPVYSYYSALPQLSAQHQHSWALLDTHDALTDWHKHFRTAGEIRSTLEALGLERIAVTEAGNGVEARGRRPLTSAR